jgi:hypothetical protein
MAEDNGIEYIALDKLEFDPKNPRLPMDLIGIKDDTAILTHMLRDESLLELMKSIGENGYSRSEPLLVVQNGKKYTVVEGNRRLAALKLLSNPQLATIRQKSIDEIISGKNQTPTSLPCIKHNKRDDVLDYLGYRHITGVKSWGALEKARYLQQLYKKHNTKKGTEENFKKLAKMIGSKSDYVGKLLAALSLYEYSNNKAYFGIKINEEDINFSILSTAIGYGNIYVFIGLDSSTDIDTSHINQENFEFLFKRLFDPEVKIEESRDLKALNAIIGSTSALEIYKEGASLSEALYYTSEIIDTFKDFIANAKKALINAKNCIEKLPEPDSEVDVLIDQVREIERIAKTIRGGLQVDRD